MRLTAYQVMQLRREYAMGNTSYSRLKAQYNACNPDNQVSRNTIAKAISGKSYQHLPLVQKHQTGKYNVGGRPKADLKTHRLLKLLLEFSEYSPATIVKKLRAKGCLLSNSSLYRLIRQHKYQP